MNSDHKFYYQRHLPHYQPTDAIFSIVFRLAGSLPKEVIDRLKAEHDAHERVLMGIVDERLRKEAFREYRSERFDEFDSLLNVSQTGPFWLREQGVAWMVSESLHYRDKKVYDLLCFCMMPNHVHLVVATGNFMERSGTALSENDQAKCSHTPLYRILQSLKAHTAKEANKILGRGGTFWQDESYDHVVRAGEELERTIWYVLQNPVKAGLIDSWEKWKWSYVKPNLT